MPATKQPRLTRPLRRSLKLISSYARLRLASGPVPQPACWRVFTCLRLASGPAQPATRYPASAHPATRPSTAQPSPPSRSSSRNQQRSPAAQQPATHPWLRSLVAETSFRPSPTGCPARRKLASGPAQQPTQARSSQAARD